MLLILCGGICRVYHGDDHGHNHGSEDPAAKGPKKAKSLQPAAYLNTIADFVHNFTDGLALGTAWGRHFFHAALSACARVAAPDPELFFVLVSGQGHRLGGLDHPRGVLP